MTRRLYTCHVCQLDRSMRAGISCTSCRSLHARPGAEVDGHTRYTADAAAQAFVASHPGGATLETVAESFGLTRERVRQIEEQALARLRRLLPVAGVAAHDVVDMLMSRHEDRRA